MSDALAPLSLSPSDAAAYIGLSKRQIYNLLANDLIKAKRSGGRTLINGPSLRAYYAGLPDFVPGAAMPNAPHIVSGSRSRRRARK